MSQLRKGRLREGQHLAQASSDGLLWKQCKHPSLCFKLPLVYPVHPCFHSTFASVSRQTRGLMWPSSLLSMATKAWIVLRGLFLPSYIGNNFTKRGPYKNLSAKNVKVILPKGKSKTLELNHFIPVHMVSLQESNLPASPVIL